MPRGPLVHPAVRRHPGRRRALVGPAAVHGCRLNL
jgi:hypothetical protein